MSQTFYVADNGKQTGPFTYDEMSRKNITKNTLVWTEGLDNWTKAEYIALLKDILNPIPPPLPNIEEKSSEQQADPLPIPQKTTNEKYFGYKLATLGERFLAALVEGIIIWIPISLIFGINDDIYDPVSYIRSALISVIVGAVLYPFFCGNLGHKIMGLKVISLEDGTDQNKASEGALREGLKSVFGIILIPSIWLLWDDNRQNLYDKVAKTIVVKVKN
jgi:uncharacterized RDD family membrane protein YckC